MIPALVDGRIEDSTAGRMTNVAIFAKAPVEGYAKTRLIPKLGAGGAAMLQKRLIERAVQTAIDAAIGPVTLWCTPDATHSTFAALRARYPVELRVQIQGDLGERMLHTFESQQFQGSTLLIGTDCVAIAAHHLQDCAASLAVSDAVTIPVEDGGYILIGLRQPQPALFQGIRWGTASVMLDTRLRAAAARIRLDELEELWDIDRPADYERALALGML